MARAGLLLFLLAPAFAQAKEPIEVRVGKQFVNAFRLKDTARQSILAAEPALKVTYPLVMDWLLWQGYVKEAEALAVARADGPEGAGLKRIVQEFTRGVRPTQQQLGVIVAAENFLRQRRAEQALSTIHTLGEPVAGSTTGVRIAWVRASALARTNRTEEAWTELGRCATLARAVGWLAMARDAESWRMKVSKGLEGALAAAKGYEEAARLLGDVAGHLDALRKRAKLHLRKGLALRKRGLAKPSEDELRLARADFVAASDVAKAARERLEAALLLCDRPS